MVTIEVHPGEGGVDAAAFAHDLADAIGKYTGRPAVSGVGGVRALHRL